MWLNTGQKRLIPNLTCLNYSNFGQFYSRRSSLQEVFNMIKGKQDLALFLLVGIPTNSKATIIALQQPFKSIKCYHVIQDSVLLAPRALGTPTLSDETLV